MIIKRDGNGERAIIVSSATALMAFGIEHLSDSVHSAHAIAAMSVATVLFFIRYHFWY